MGPGKGVSFLDMYPTKRFTPTMNSPTRVMPSIAKGRSERHTWNWTAESQMGDTKMRFVSPLKLFPKPNIRSTRNVAELRSVLVVE